MRVHLPRGRFGTRSSHRVVVVVALLVAISACGDDAPYVPAGVIRSPAPVVDVAPIPDETGDFTFRARPGALLIAYFGYTTCPDVCPTTLADLRAALRQLDDQQNARIDFAMVTIDPERDAISIDPYVRAFIADGYGLSTSDPELLATVAEPFGVIYSVETMEDGHVEVVHSAWLYAIDENGELLLSWAFGTDRDAIARDLRHLLEEIENAA